MLPLSRQLPRFPSLLALTLSLAGAVSCGGDDGSSPSDKEKDASVDAAVKTDAKVTPKDTGVTTPAKDTGATTTANPTLDPIAGRYLMRWDTFGTATSGVTPLVVSIRSRVSILLVTELTVDGDHLTAKERICNQTAKQRCLAADGTLNGSPTCGTATTVVDQRVIDSYLHKTMFTRDYTLGADGKAITAGLSTADLGYDGDGPLPSSDTDPLVWDPIPNQDPREGMLTSIKITNNFGLGGMVSCDVYGVQKFVTQFSGTLGGSDSVPTFPDMDLTFVKPDSTAARLGVSGSAACNAAGDSPLDKSTVQLVRYGDSDGDAFWDCYDDSVFEDQVPATADAIIDG